MKHWPTSLLLTGTLMTKALTSFLTKQRTSSPSSWWRIPGTNDMLRFSSQTFKELLPNHSISYTEFGLYAYHLFFVLYRKRNTVALSLQHNWMKVQWSDHWFWETFSRCCIHSILLCCMFIDQAADIFLTPLQNRSRFNSCYHVGDLDNYVVLSLQNSIQGKSKGTEDRWRVH